MSVEDVTDATSGTPEIDALAREYRAVVTEILEHRNAQGVAEAIAGITDPGQLADTVAYSPDLDPEQRVELLETLDVRARLEKAVTWARDALADLTLRDRVRSQVNEGMERDQGEHLRRQSGSDVRLLTMTRSPATRCPASPRGWRSPGQVVTCSRSRPTQPTASRA